MRKQSAMITREGFSKLLGGVRKRAGKNVLGLSYITSLVIDELMMNWEYYKKEIIIEKEREEKNA